MSEFVHQEVRAATGSSSSPVELAVVPADGERTQVQEAVSERSGSYDEEALGMLRVTLPANEVEAFVELDCIRSVSMGDSSISQQGNGNFPLE